MILRAALFLWLCAASAVADEAARAQDAFEAWLAARDGRGALSIRHNGTERAVRDHGLSPAQRHPVASLSKSITATCALTFVADGTWQLDTTVREVLGTQGADITLAALITHSAGLGPDGTQGIWNVFLPMNLARAPGVGARALDRGVQPGNAGRFSYNNENYAVLGDMITAEAGQDYEAVCRDRVLVPAGADGAADPRVGAMLPWGGWSMTVTDFGAFMDHWYPHPDIAVPAVAVDDNGLTYGAGMFVRASDRGPTFSHSGFYCLPAQIRMGSFAVSWDNTWTAVAVYDVCTDGGDLEALYAGLAKALLGEVR